MKLFLYTILFNYFYVEFFRTMCPFWSSDRFSHAVLHHLKTKTNIRFIEAGVIFFSHSGLNCSHAKNVIADTQLVSYGMVQLE